MRLLGFVLLFFALSYFFLSETPETVLAQGLAALVAALLASAVMLRIDGAPLSSLGLPLGLDSLRSLGRGAVAGFLPAFLLIVAAVALGGVRYASAPGSVLEYTGTAFWALVVLTFPAAAEEVLFRGYPMRVLGTGFGPIVALLTTSILFGYLHGANPNVDGLALANIAAAGVFLGVVYLKTGSLWWATGAHLGWNFATGFVADLPVSGMRLVDAPLLEPSGTGVSILTGGAFGLEGGILATVIIVGATAFVARSDVLQPSLPALARGSQAPLSRQPRMAWFPPAPEEPSQHNSPIPTTPRREAE